MHISISSNGSVCKLSKTDEYRLKEVVNLCSAMSRHAEDDKIVVPAAEAVEALEKLVLALNGEPKAAPPTASGVS